MIVILAGLPGSGKSTLARKLAERTAGVVLDKDAIRSALFPAADIEYSAEQDDFCMNVIFQTAAYLLRKYPKRFVFIDGRPFSKRAQLQQAIAAAEKLDQLWRIIECVCSEETAKQRLQQQAGEHPAANRDFDLYQRVKAQWEDISEPKLMINTDEPEQVCVKKALTSLA